MDAPVSKLKIYNCGTVSRMSSARRLVPRIKLGLEYSRPVICVVTANAEIADFSACEDCHSTPRRHNTETCCFKETDPEAMRLGAIYQLAKACTSSVTRGADLTPYK